LTLSYGLAVLIGVLIGKSREYRPLQKILLILCLALFLLQQHLPELKDLRQRDWENLWLSAGLTILVMSLMAIFMASLGAQRSFQTFLVIIGIRFFIFYLQALGGLAMTGLGLIVSGVLLISLGVAWNKYRRAISAWVEGWAR
jgi:uncharacterized membrane protein